MANQTLTEFNSSLLRAKGLERDPAAYAVAAIVVSALFPGVARWWHTNQVILAPVVALLLGHFGVRVGSVLADGRQMAAVAATLPELPSGLGLPAEKSAAIAAVAADVFATPSDTPDTTGQTPAFGNPATGADPLVSVPVGTGSDSEVSMQANPIPTTPLPNEFVVGDAGVGGDLS